MARRVVAIVEGHGDVEALPILFRRLAERLEPPRHPELPRPIRIKRQRFVRENELERTVELAARQCGAEGAILILLDADEDCPAEVAPELLRRATKARPDRAIHIVLAKAEFEAWFLAAAGSLAGQRGLAPDLAPPADPEAVRDAKGWLSQWMPSGRSYRETLDQPALSAILDLEQARRSSRSFDKLSREIAAILSP